MKPVIFFLLLQIAFTIGAPSLDTTVKNDVWALLIAGSNTWSNYRHQADICHAYHILLAKGIPADKIVVMMYDDIANHEENPQKGVIINAPGGPNVYQGVKIDYKGDDVNVVNFLNVLKGNSTGVKGIGTGRVINSTSNSHVFLNFVDHGGAGILCFPNEYLYADNLEKTLQYMVKEKRFGKFLAYIEACEAGSMFDNILEENNNILISTASAPDESSYAYYCEEGTLPCLGDLYSVKWMEHVDNMKGDLFETIFHQFMAIRTAVDKSHVELYGDYRLGYDILQFHKKENTSNSSPKKLSSAINNRDVPIHYLKKKVENSNDVKNQQIHANYLSATLKLRSIADELISSLILKAVNGDFITKQNIETNRVTLSKEIFPCYRNIIEKFNSACFNTNTHTYFLQHFYKLANLCALNKDINGMLKAMPNICLAAKNELKINALIV